MLDFVETPISYHVQESNVITSQICQVGFHNNLLSIIDIDFIFFYGKYKYNLLTP